MRMAFVMVLVAMFNFGLGYLLGVAETRLRWARSVKRGFIYLASVSELRPVRGDDIYRAFSESQDDLPVESREAC
jgi:hypothetical protein